MQGWGEDSIWGMSGAPILGALPEIQISMQSLRNLDGPHTRRSPACHADHFHRRETGAPLYYFCKHNICAQRLPRMCGCVHCGEVVLFSAQNFPTTAPHLSTASRPATTLVGLPSCRGTPGPRTVTPCLGVPLSVWLSISLASLYIYPGRQKVYGKVEKVNLFQ